MGDGIMAEKQGIKILIIIVIALLALVVFLLLSSLVYKKEMPMVEMIKTALGFL